MPSHKACGTHEPRKSISCLSGRIRACYETLYARTRLIADATYELPIRQNSETPALNERIGPLVSHDGEQILDSYRTLENGLK
jgi:hypothetical protein